MIYFIEQVGSDWVKVGFSRAGVSHRLMELQAGCPDKLRIVDSVPGTASDERLAHVALGKVGRGEWFPRTRAMRLLRAMRRVGATASVGFIRARENEKRARRWRHAFIRKATRVTSARLAAAALKMPETEMKRRTGLCRASWERIARGRNLPSSEHLLNSLTYHPGPLVALFSVITKRPLMPQMQAVIDEADAMRIGV